MVADADELLMLSGLGDVLSPEKGIAAIGSGAGYAEAAARALAEKHLNVAAGNRQQIHARCRSNVRLYQQPNHHRRNRRRMILSTESVVFASRPALPRLIIRPRNFFAAATKQRYGLFAILRRFPIQ